ncbi:hypothetical protein PHLH3_22700 [Pseudomonas sp. St386]|uniref:hypothetical protein n=1 Tax=Pseudomonas TaxID=286 RepID=UPI00042E3150|nr:MULTISPECIES: hypothetical protein [Pseudomonas]AHL36920.1 hypothetical protein CD58_18765 [Pseudomonas brassicacearum]RON04650.1 hypothetical protein BK657_10680 [Pseudomonas brassicacearum]BBP52644.1 hypothetical protein PHLH3_22700 [Pseudomonas sp. St386]
MQEFGFDNAAYSPDQRDITQEACGVFAQFKRGTGQSGPMALSPIAIPVGIEPVNEKPCLCPWGRPNLCLLEPPPIKMFSAPAGILASIANFGVLRNGKISLSKAWGQMLHVLMGQLRWDGLDSQDSIDEGKAVQ